MAQAHDAAMIVGWREWAGLPELGAARVKAKIDTGARTSSIHAWSVEPFRRAGRSWARFELAPLQHDDAARLACAAPIIDERLVRSSSGHAERRVVVATTLALGTSVWEVELTLARRDKMGFRMLIGRTALAGRALVDPSGSFLCGGGEGAPPL